MSSDSDVRRSSYGWSLLRGGGLQASGLEIPTVPTEVISPAGQVRLALGEGGEARLLLPLQDQERLERLFDAPSLRIVVSIFRAHAAAIRFLDLTCLSRDLETVFAEVADEILARVLAGEDCLAAAQSTIQDFRTLLLRSARTVVPRSVVVGLVGELLVLNRLLDRSSRAWRTWRGPDGERHDFRGGCSSLEVKATTRAGNSLIRVNSMEQMEPPSGGSLHLLHVTIEQAAAGLLTVSALGRAAIDKADKPDAVQSLISAVGCDNVEAADWNEMAFRHEREQLFEVHDGFPRLVPAMLVEGVLPLGLQGLTYEIDLAAASAFACDSDRSTELEKELAACT